MEENKYDDIFGRSFSENEKRKLGYGAFLVLFLFVFTFFTVSEPYLAHLPTLTTRMTMSLDQKMVKINQTTMSYNSSDSKQNKKNDVEIMTKKGNDTVNTSSDSQIHESSVGKKTDILPMCRMEAMSDFCEVNNGNVRIDGNSSTVYYFMPSNSSSLLPTQTSWHIRPYARKGDQFAMNSVTEWSIKSVNAISECAMNHNVPAVVFSVGGFAGNNFHDFTDILIPLYLTSRRFDGEVKFFVTNNKPWWLNKFKPILTKLSNYQVIDIDNEEGTHCFAGTTVIIGLKRPHGKRELTSDPEKSSYSMRDFRQFLRSAYSLKKVKALRIVKEEKMIGKPRLLIVSRKRTRAFMNTEEIVSMATELGFEVVTSEANMKDFPEIVNSCDVMLGVHGAGLTNMVFLADNAIVIQILPLGGFKWLARTDFGEPSKRMSLRYLEYYIEAEESSLIKQYTADDKVLNNPSEVSKQGWMAFKTIYLNNQNVMLHVNKFRPTLLKALDFLHQ